MITQLEERHHKINLKNMGFEDKVAEMETEIAELKNKLEDVEWDLHKSREKEVRAGLLESGIPLLNGRLHDECLL